MAQVSISNKAMTDLRFDRLAIAMGLASRWEAIGRMIPLWNVATEMGSGVIEVEFVNRILNHPSGASDLVACGLAFDHEKGIRLAGFSAHCSWLEKSRESGNKGKEQGKKGGRPKTPGGVKEINPGGGSETKPRRNSNSNSDSKEIRDSGSGIQGDQGSEISTPGAIPIGDPDRDAAWSELVTAHAEIRDRFGGDPVPWPALPSRNFLERWDEALQRCGGDRFQAAAVFRHVATVRASQAIALGHARYFTPSRTLDEESFWKSAELSEAQAIAEASKSHSPLEASLAEVRRLEREARQ